jgi:anaerobic carbon-monoxide dehydrogenase iron sulfur subunit
MTEQKSVKILRFYPEKCKGCLECEKACSMVYFKTKNGGEQSAIRITKTEKGYTMHVCDQRGLCLDMCPVGALTRRKNGVVLLDKDICIGCQACVGFCPIGAMRKADVRIEPFKCISCGSCVRACPEKALELVDTPLSTIKQVVYYKQGV